MSAGLPMCLNGLDPLFNVAWMFGMPCFLKNLVAIFVKKVIAAHF